MSQQNIPLIITRKHLHLHRITSPVRMPEGLGLNPGGQSININ